MEKRVRDLAGQLTVRSGPGLGTSLEFTIPLNLATEPETKP
jgi:signal transduction histidine kinase